MRKSFRSFSAPASAATPPAHAGQITRGYLICLVGTVLWSSTAVFIRYLTENYQLPPFVLAFWRDLCLAVALLVVFSLFSRRRLAIPPGQVGFLAREKNLTYLL